MNAAYRAVVRSPWLVVAVVAAATVVLGLGALRLRVDSSVATLLPRGDPAKQRYDEIVETVETIRTTQPDVAVGLRRLADVFDYDGLRDLLGR